MRFTDINRRRFLQAAAGVAASLVIPSWMPRLAFAQSGIAAKGDTLVVIFLRGAADGLNIIVPHGEEAYYRARPSLAIARPDDKRAAKRSLDLDGFFGLHPSLSPLVEAWQAEHLAVVHACGSPDDSRSHFRAMELMERGVTDELGPASGWLGRHLASHHTGNHSPLRALGLGKAIPRSLYGEVPVTALRSIVDFHLGGDIKAVQGFKRTLASSYQKDSLASTGQLSLDLLDALEKLDPATYRGAKGLSYPESDFGLGLKQIAMLVKADLGLEVATLDHGGWDTHIAQGSGEGFMAGLLEDLAHGLAAFYEDLSAHHKRLSVVVMSEFGRRVKENASLGTDHGHGGLMFVLSGHAVGGKVHGVWPGLQPESLVGPGDLAVTTDYRDVLAEICQKRLHNPALGEIFPGYTPQSMGIVR